MINSIEKLVPPETISTSPSMPEYGNLGDKEVSRIRPPSQINEISESILDRDFQGILMGCCLIELIAGIVLWILGSTMAANPMMIAGIIFFSFGLGGGSFSCCCISSMRRLM